MPTQWIHRIHIIIPVEDQEAANAMAANIDPDFGGAETFGAGNLSADSAPPPTHILVATSATEAMRAEMFTALGDWQTAGLSAMPQFWQLDAATSTLVSSNASAATGQPWTVDDTLGAVSLQMIADQI